MRFTFGVIVTALLGCGPYESGPAGPKTAAEKNARDREQDEDVATPVDGTGKSWGGWRYRGHRDDCFFVVERECFTTLADACEATECKGGCTSRGAGPAIVYCK